MFNPEQTKAFVTYESAIGAIHDKLGDDCYKQLPNDQLQNYKCWEDLQLKEDESIFLIEAKARLNEATLTRIENWRNFENRRHKITVALKDKPLKRKQKKVSSFSAEKTKPIEGTFLVVNKEGRKKLNQLFK